MPPVIPRAEIMAQRILGRGPDAVSIILWRRRWYAGSDSGWVYYLTIKRGFDRAYTIYPHEVPAFIVALSELMKMLSWDEKKGEEEKT
jgi:hypothetical protein